MILARTAYVGTASWHKKVDVRCTLDVTKGLIAYNYPLINNIIYFSGAELENLINQAALKAVIEGRETVSMQQLDFARDKIIMG